MKMRLLLGAAVLAVVFIACSGNNSSSSDSNTTTPVDQNSTTDDQNTSVDDNTSTPIDEPIDDNGSATLKSFLEYTDRLYVRKPSSTFPFGSSRTQQNLEAPVTSMCYTKHDQQFNPCYVCHQDIIDDGRANVQGDGVLQNAYLFSDYGFTNHWTNLFEDRSARIAEITDEEIDAYVNQDNYSPLKIFLEDYNFTGYIPDVANFHLGSDAFYSDGFAKDGSGWVAFNYKPLPSTFWPVNGSTDDVLIRLHKDLRKNVEGNLSVTAYKFNLAIVEAAIKNIETISVDNLDENEIGVDLNGDGILGVVNEINRPTHYVGKGSHMGVEPFLYPKYTEFLHSVRYIGAKENGDIYNAPRMKELRYMIKEKSYEEERFPLNKRNIALVYDDEAKEKEVGALPVYATAGPDKGLDNKMGWWIQGFIEDASGNLRLQNHEETTFCMGCHTFVGSTIDSVFSFARKVEGKEGWGYIDLRAMVDVPNVGETEGEILTYFKRVGGGSEFRADNDTKAQYFPGGVLDEAKVKAAANVYELITPTRGSALQMNKSYKALVESQNFILGRDGNAKPVENVFRTVDGETPTLPAEKQYQWDMRLDWSQQLGSE